MKYIEMLKNFHNEESGQDLVEYALVLLAVVIAVLAVRGDVQNTISGAFTAVSGKITSAVSSS